MKAYTDISQSKKLAEILPITTIDLAWNIFCDGSTRLLRMGDWEVFENAKSNVKIIPCWSLSALLGILPSPTLDSSNDHHYRLHCMERFTEWHDNIVDACVEMILNLHE